MAVFCNKLMRCITFRIPANRHLMLGDELLNYGVDAVLGVQTMLACTYMALTFIGH